jgi:hypothetical protein
MRTQPAAAEVSGLFLLGRARVQLAHVGMLVIDKDNRKWMRLTLTLFEAYGASVTQLVEQLAALPVGQLGQHISEAAQERASPYFRRSLLATKALHLLQ